MNQSDRSEGRAPLAPYRVPAWLFALGIAGFACGLAGEGIWDMVAGAALGTPIAIIAGFAIVATARGRGKE